MSSDFAQDAGAAARRRPRRQPRDEAGAAPPPEAAGLADMLDTMIDGDAGPDSGALMLKPRPDIHEDAELRSIQSRALAYLRAGAPVHFRGPAGMGKTTLALHIAAQLGRPVALVTGDSSMTSADLLGRETGFDTRQVRDRYIQRVERIETSLRAAWTDSILSTAVARGYTLVYDEFTRAPPEANNALLSALEERVLIFSSAVREQRYLRAHPQFRAILTSNPDEYVGVSAAPDALFDRMITFDLTWCAAETETGIVMRRTGIAADDAARVVAVVRALRTRTECANPPSIRTAIMIARIMQAQNVPASARDERFVQICLDVLETRAPRSSGSVARERYLSDLREQILNACPGDPMPGGSGTENRTAA